MRCFPTTRATPSRRGSSRPMISNIGNSCAVPANAVWASSTMAAARSAPARSISRRTGVSRRCRSPMSTSSSSMPRCRRTILSTPGTGHSLPSGSGCHDAQRMRSGRISCAISGKHFLPFVVDTFMKRDAESLVAELQAWASWRHAPVLAASLCVFCILGLFWQTTASIVAIWWRSETFAHGFVVVPICLWLTWRRRETLALIAAKPWWPGLAFVFLAGALWLVMGVADVLGVKQFALAFMIQAAIITVLGTGVARALAFPLAFLLFAIPAGEILVPVLMDWTADFTVNALRWSGVPVYREANHLTIPSGRWSIVEACSGIRYIIASFMVGTLYAAIAYRSTRRRVMFIAASIVVPIVANWVRAYMIVMIGHLSNNRYAVGVDHLIYGWIFFGVVMVLLFWVGSFWQEDPAPTRSAAVSSTWLSSSIASDPAPGRM